MPKDLETTLISNSKLLDKWNSLTPLARNEWICWITIVKKPKTRKDHIDRLSKDILEGNHRPCCWAGCPHRKSITKKIK